MNRSHWMFLAALAIPACTGPEGLGPVVPTDADMAFGTDDSDMDEVELDDDTAELETLLEDGDERNEDDDAGAQAPVAFVSGEQRGEAVSVDADGQPAARELAPTRITATPVAELDERRPHLGQAAAAPAVIGTARTLTRLAEMNPADTVRVLVELDLGPSGAFDFSTLRSQTGETRRAVIDQRKQLVNTAAHSVVRELEANGARVSGTHWLSGQIVVDIAAGDARGVLDLPGVRDLAIDDATNASATYDGDDIREGTLAVDLLDSGYDGMTGAQAGGRVRIGIIESNGGTNWPAQAHVGWNSWLNSFSRLVEVYACNSSSCSATSATNNGNTHGNAVMWAAGGDITDGQDSAISGTTQRIERSGVAPESYLYYYSDGGTCGGIVSALEESIEDDIDVVNMSLSVGAGQCDPAYSCATTALRNATNAGVLLVAAAGNAGHTGSCSLDYPALRPEVVAVGALRSNDNTAYGNLTLRTSSSQGPLSITLQNGLERTTAGVDITAPGEYYRNFTAAPNSYGGSTWGGTSMASPVVAGIAANMRDMFSSIGWHSANADPRALMVNMLLHGDSWDFSTGAERTTGVSHTSGFGRARAHWPSSANLSGPWGWGWRSFTIKEGETHTWTVESSGPEHPSVTQWKWAVTWFDSDLEAASDIVIRVYDTCPSGGGPDQYVAGDWSYNLRKGIQLTQSQIAGRCLEMRATAYQTPDAGITLYSADYYHGGSTAEH